MTTNHPFTDRVAVIGWPDSLERYHSHSPATWTPATLARLRALGFTQVQLNLAWGARPDDEPLNLEDIVDAPWQTVALNCRPGSAARERRRALVRDRIALAKAAGLKTLFLFGAPYNRHAHYGDTPPNCISDPVLAERYAELLERFAAAFPGLDDILVYTYDQDAWLCSEFGRCTRCNGVPLHDRLPPFLNRLRRAWRSINPQGRCWWEPWELSAGQVHACVERLEPAGMGLALHANIAECMSAVVADPWLVRTARQAQQHGLPVWVEWFLGGQSEETEPLGNLAHPLSIWRGLQKLRAVAGLTGLKEYYGLMPERADTDVNLQTTALFLREPDLDEDAVLQRLAPPHPAVATAWRLASDGIERYPWDCSWLGREIGRSRTDHALSAAILRPMVCPTPSWESTRGTIFMRTENTAAHPWMMEDVALRAQQAADLWQQALDQMDIALAQMSASQQAPVRQWRESLDELRRRAVAYACHLRATMIAIAERERAVDGLPPRETAHDELRRVLTVSRANHAGPWEEMDCALRELDGDWAQWLAAWLQPSHDQNSKGLFSLTSS